MSCAEPLDFGEVVKHPVERISPAFAWLEHVATHWKPRTLYSIGDCVRLSGTGGYVLRCEQAGETGFHEPVLPRAANVVRRDGSVVWRSQVANDEALDTIVHAAVTAPGLVVSDVRWNAREVVPSIEGGVVDIDYSGLCEVTTQSGQKLAGVFTVKVRAKRCEEQ